MAAINKVTKPTIKNIFDSVQISDWETPMTLPNPTKKRGKSKNHPNPDINCMNPYSKISCLVVYLYSMELG